MKRVVATVFFSLCLFPALAVARVEPFELPWMNAEDGGSEENVFRSNDYESTVFVIEAYFQSCGACNSNARQVNQLAEKYADHGAVKVLDVGIDRQDSEYASWIRKHRPNHPVLKDANHALIRQIGAKFYPTTVVVDCHGEIAYRSVGVWSSLSSVEKGIEKALQSCERQDRR